MTSLSNIGLDFLAAVGAFALVWLLALWVGKIPRRDRLEGDTESVTVLRNILAAIVEQNTALSTPVNSGDGEAIATLKVIFSSIESFNKDSWRRHEKSMAALDSLNLNIDKFVSSQDKFLRTMFGPEAGLSDAPTDVDPEISRTAKRMMERYPNLSWEESIDRARRTMVYQSRGDGMGERA